MKIKWPFLYEKYMFLKQEKPYGKVIMFNWRLKKIRSVVHLATHRKPIYLIS